MPRFPEQEPMYRAFADFIERCILDDKSLLLPERQAWTAENVRIVKERLVDHPELDASLNFEDKLRKQMAGATADQWLVLADVHYLYVMPSSSMRLETKLKQVRWVAEQGGVSPQNDSDPIWKPLGIGFSRTGQRFHLRYLQLWLILLFANALKQDAAPRSKLTEYGQMQALLDQLLDAIPARTDRAYDMRHAILYLMFPDQYEPIISTADKDAILKALGSRAGGTLPRDRDAALKQLRSVLVSEFDRDSETFNYYREPLRSQWKTETSTVVATVDDSARSVSTEVDQVQRPLPEVVTVLNLLKRTRNVILQGPPGTGKTFIAMRAARALVEPQLSKPLSEEANIQRAVEGLTLYNTIALSMYAAGEKGQYTVNDLLKQKVLAARERLFAIDNPRQALWSALNLHADPDSKTVHAKRRDEPALFDKAEASRWYLTDEGQEYVRENLADRLAMLRASSQPHNVEAFIERVTFHQSFAYEDFVEGWRPVKEGGEAELSYTVKAGILKRIARRAETDPSNRYVLVIDEINRGNIAKILGELITLLEDDKRLGQPNEVRLSLPYSGDSFGLPSNLYIIGTMNTADRSIALLDVALRRRFAFVDVLPNPSLLAGTVVSSESGSVDLGELLASLNRRIAEALDRSYQIGHSYFLRVKQRGEDERLGELEFVWNTQVLPLLEEYFYGQREVLANLLQLAATADTGNGVTENEPLNGDDLVMALMSMVRARS